MDNSIFTYSIENLFEKLKKEKSSASRVYLIAPNGSSKKIAQFRPGDGIDFTGDIRDFFQHHGEVPCEEISTSFKAVRRRLKLPERDSLSELSLVRDAGKIASSELRFLLLVTTSTEKRYNQFWDNHGVPVELAVLPIHEKVYELWKETEECPPMYEKYAFEAEYDID